MNTKSLSLNLFLLWLSLNLLKVHAKSVNEASIVRREAISSGSANPPSENTASNSNNEDQNNPVAAVDSSDSANPPSENTASNSNNEDENNQVAAIDTTSATNADTTKETTLDTTSTTNPDTTPAYTATPAQDNENAALGLAPFTFLILSLTFLINTL